MKPYFFLLIFMIILSPTIALAQVTGIQRMEDFWNLPDQELGTYSFGDSSFDRTGLNNDGFVGMFSRIYYENGRHVLFDSNKPGCIYRIWFTLPNPIANLEFFFDGEQTPLISIGQEEMFENSVYPFLTPLVWDDDISSGGFISYVPICYEESLKITSDGYLFFYNINATTFPESTPVSTFSDSMDTAKASNLFDPENMGVDPKDTSGVEYYTTTNSINSGETETFFEKIDGGIIGSIIITPDIIDGSLLNDVSLVAYFDDPQEPTIEVPLGMFFGATAPDTEVHGIMVGIKDGSLYCFFPMPFFFSANLAIVNQSDTEIDMEIEVGFLDENPDDHAAIFKAIHRNVAPTILNEDHLLANPSGQGKIVGVIQISAGNSGIGFLEGDERFYPDGLLTPTIQGTGTEDYYNGGWYFNNRTTFTLPTHGHQQSNHTGTLDVIGMYRLHPADTLHFHDGAIFSIEHDALNYATDEIYRTCTYIYNIDEPALVYEGEFNPGDPLSESSFQYQSSQDVLVKGNYFYDGDNDDIRIFDKGYRTRDWASFSITINPENDGVRIVRRVDQGFGYEKARVWVNEQDAGVWIMPYANPFKRWRDTVFEIPPSLSKGQKSLEIKLENLDTEKSFSHFTYWFYSWKKPILSRMTDLVLTSDENEILVGDTVELSAMGLYPSGISEQVTGWLNYELSDPSLAQISFGQLTALAPGVLTITGMWGELSSNPVKITIIGPSDDDDDNDDSSDDDDSSGDDDDDECGCG